MATIVRDADTARLLEAAAKRLGARLEETLEVRERAVLAVPGGRSVARIFDFLLGTGLDWGRIHLFAVDERLVLPADPDFNFAIAEEHLVAPLVASGRMPRENAHPFVFAPASPDLGVARYERELEALGGRFDVVLLSAGEDGHVAALFPGHPSIGNPRHGFLTMDDSPKPPPGRMTSSASLIRASGSAVLLFVGEAKREALERFEDDAIPVSGCPAKLVLELGDATVFTDLPPREKRIPQS